jgi:hypothetical protein
VKDLAENLASPPQKARPSLIAELVQECGGVDHVSENERDQSGAVFLEEGRHLLRLRNWRIRGHLRHTRATGFARKGEKRLES